MDPVMASSTEPRRQSIRASVGGGEPVEEVVDAATEFTPEEVALQIAQENFLRQQAEAEQLMDAKEGSTASKLERARARAKMAKAMLTEPASTESGVQDTGSSKPSKGSSRASKRSSKKA